MASYSYIGQGGTVVGYDPILRDNTDAPILDSNGQYIETDTSTHLRAVVVSGVRGGAVTGGAAGASATTLTLTADVIASGGAVVGYDPILRDNTGDPILDSNGQYIETDVSTHLRAVVLAGDRGGAVAGGSVVQLKASSFAATLGAVAGGSAVVDSANLIVSTFAATGGAILGGNATFASGTVSPDSYSQIGTGGSVVDGTASTGKGGSHIASGGAVVGGAAGIDALSNYSQTGTGGAVVAGTASVARVRVQALPGGAVAAGAARVRVAVVVTPTAGAVVSGLGTASSSALQTMSFVPSGGAVVAGEADVYRSRTITGMGQVFYKDSRTTEFYRPDTPTIFYPDDETMELAA